MGDEWLKTLLEKMDQDRRDGEARQAASVARIEHLVEGQAAKLDELGRRIDDSRSEIMGRVEGVRDEIIGQVENVRSEVIGRVEDVRKEVNDVRREVTGRMDQAYVHFQSATAAVRWASISTVIGIAAIALAAVVAILGLR